MKSILIVDDAAFIRMMIKDSIKDLFEVVGESDSAEEAIKLYREKRPDIVTMDISLVGELNGIDALQKIKEIEPNAVVIMVSSMGEEEFIRRSIDLGASEFIVKPFSKATIRDTLVAVTGG